MQQLQKTEKQLGYIQESCKRAAAVMRKLIKMVRPGITTGAIDSMAYQLVSEYGDSPAFLNYQPEGAPMPFPASVCISLNEEIVHGIPSHDKVINEGDVVTIDCGINHEGYFSDHAVTVIAGKGSEEDETLLSSTQTSLDRAIEGAQPGNHVGDIGYAVESFVANRYGIVRGLSGHGVGIDIHEDPFIPNYGNPGDGMQLVPGMVLAIEPMLTCGRENITLLDDGFTIITQDKSHSAHFEHTVHITEEGPIILTK